MGAKTPVHYLVVVEGVEPQARLRLREEPLVLGRKAPSDWLLADPMVSRQHCRVFLAEGEVLVADLHSTNGTYIDGRLVFGSMALPPGSKLELGSHILQHVLQDGE